MGERRRVDQRRRERTGPAATGRAPARPSRRGRRRAPRRELAASRFDVGVGEGARERAPAGPPPNRAGLAARSTSPRRRQRVARRPRAPAPRSMRAPPTHATPESSRRSTTERRRPSACGLDHGSSGASLRAAPRARPAAAATTRRASGERRRARRPARPPRLSAIEATEDDPRLDRAVPVVDLERERNVDGVASSGVVELAVDAEGDAERPPRPLSRLNRACRSPSPIAPHVAHPRRRHQQPDLGIAVPERPHPGELLGDVETEALGRRRSRPRSRSEAAAPRPGPRPRTRRTPRGRRRCGPPRSRARPPPDVRRTGSGARRRPRVPPSRSKPGMLRPEPRPRPSSPRPTTTTGLPCASTSREATIPTTPGCHPSPAITSAGASASGSGSAARARSAAATTSRSVSRRSRLARSSSAAIAAARSASSVSISSTPGVGPATSARPR